MVSFDHYAGNLIWDTQRSILLVSFHSQLARCQQRCQLREKWTRSTSKPVETLIIFVLFFNVEINLNILSHLSSRSERIDRCSYCIGRWDNSKFAGRHQTPFTRYNWLWNWLYNRLSNRLYNRFDKHGLTTVLNEQTVRSTRLLNRL